MLTVGQVLPDIQRALGGVDEPTAYSKLNDAVEVLSTESEWNSMLAYVDVWANRDGWIVLPNQVGAVLAVNVGGRPTQLHDAFFNFHLNGPGDGWGPKVGFHTSADMNTVSTFVDVDDVNGSYLACLCDNPADAGKSFRVFGYDLAGNWIKSVEGGITVDGFLVPINAAVLARNSSAPLLGSIDSIQRAATLGDVQLYTVTSANVAIAKIGGYEPDEVNPEYRRIRINRLSSPNSPGGQSLVPARIAFRKAVETLSTASDIIPLHSRYALILMTKAFKKFEEDRVEEGAKYQSLAVSYLTKKQLSLEVPSGPSIQVADNNLLAEKNNRIDM
jgi:hypothetical protein